MCLSAFNHSVTCCIGVSSAILAAAAICLSGNSILCHRLRPAASYETCESDAYWLQATFVLVKGNSHLWNTSPKIPQPTTPSPTHLRNGERISDTSDSAQVVKLPTTGSDDPVHPRMTQVSSVDPPAVFGTGCWP